MFKDIIVSFALWLLNRCKVNYFLYPTEEKQTIIEGLVQQVQAKFADQSGEFKRSQVLRAAINTFPKAEERELGLAIELAVQKRKNV